MLKAGLLLPRSTVYPLIGHDFLDGIKASLAESGILKDVEFISSNIGFGIDEADVYARNEELLLQQNVDLVVAFIDGRSAEMLQPLFTATGKILLIVNMGAHYSYDSLPSSTMLCHTFDTAFNCRLTGRLAAAESHPKAVFATSYYDAGYLQCFAMATRYLKEGNSITYNFISDFRPADFNTTVLQTYLQENLSDDTLLCLFSGDVSPLIYKDLADLQKNRELHFYVSPMMLDESLKTAMGKDFRIDKVKGYTAWNSRLDNEFNHIFQSAFRSFSGREAGIISLLGWETGTILRSIIGLFNEGIKGTEAVKKLLQSTFESPRGWLRFDEETQQTYSPSSLVSISGNFEMNIEKTLEDTGAERKEFIAEKPEGAASGWRNTYLCS